MSRLIEIAASLGTRHQIQNMTTCKRRYWRPSPSGHVLRRQLEQAGQRGVPEGWKPVPVEPTPEMIDAASNAHMPFGDMDIAVRMAIM